MARSATRGSRADEGVRLALATLPYVGSVAGRALKTTE